ncbi:hypothetical protein ACFLQR_04040, partial [Verrucomicrobiota bacterium]
GEDKIIWKQENARLFRFFYYYYSAKSVRGVSKGGENMIRPSTIYELDEDLEVAGSAPLGSPNLVVHFDSEQFHRIYLQNQDKDNSPYIDIFTNSERIPTVEHHFCEHATSAQMEQFWDYCRSKSVVDKCSKRWGDVKIDWGGPGSGAILKDYTAVMTVYFDESISFAFLRIGYVPDLPTYTDLFQDYQFLKDLFDASQKNA